MKILESKLKYVVDGNKHEAKKLKLTEPMNIEARVICIKYRAS